MFTHIQHHSRLGLRSASEQPHPLSVLVKDSCVVHVSGPCVCVSQHCLARLMRLPVFNSQCCCLALLSRLSITEELLFHIRRPRPWPRQGRRLGPPQVWNFSFLAFQGRLPALKSHRLNIPLACFILQPTGTPRPHINGFLWASKPAVCQPLNPLKRLKTLKNPQNPYNS